MAVEELTQPQKDEGKVERIAGQYVDMVYGAALRQMGDVHAAADVTQAVFLVVMRKAEQGKLSQEDRMAGWLMTITGYAVKEARRAAVRRRHHEEHAAREAAREACEMALPTAEESAAVLAVVDEAVLRLGAVDREIVVRRYLQGERTEDVAAALGMKTEAVRRRVARAVEKLRKMVVRRGVAPAAGAAVGIAMEKCASAHAPANVLAAVAKGQGASALAKAVLWRMVMVKAISVAAFAVGVVAVGAGAVVAVERLQTGGQVAATAPADPYAVLEVVKVEDPGSDALVKETLAGVEAGRAKLKTLAVEGVSVMEKRDEALGRWVEIGRVEGTAWQEMNEPRRARVEVTSWLGVQSEDAGGRRALECMAEAIHLGIDLPLPWTPTGGEEQGFIEAWDGQKLEQINAGKHEGPNSTPFSTVKKDRRFIGLSVLGGCFSTQVISDQWNNPMTGTQMDILRMRGVVFSARKVMLAGNISAIEMSAAIPPFHADDFKGTGTWWFDPARGYALLGTRTAVEGTRGVVARQVVEGLTEAAPGVFYPSRGAGEFSTASGQHLRWSFEARQVVANGPIDAALFTVRTVYPTNVPIYVLNGGETLKVGR